MPVYDALCGNEKIRHILSRHEQGAAHAAEGYAQSQWTSRSVHGNFRTRGYKLSDRNSKCIHGFLTNDSFNWTSPITGVNTSYMIGRDAFQEADIIGITTPITKANYQPRTIAEIPTIG